MAGFTFTSLTPSAYLDRAAWVFRDRTAVVDGERSFTYAEFADRAHRLAGALLGLGVPPGGRVAALCVNSHTMAGAAQRRAAGRGGARSAQYPAVAG
jgi:fatty-acyl-CoA synthase